MGQSFFDFQAKRNKRAARPPVSEQPAAPGAAGGAASVPILTVSQLTSKIDRAVRGAFPAPIVVRGEVSNFNRHSASGHAYFTLKDAQACIDCVIFRDDLASVRFQPADGQELLATGRIAVYAARGRYQLYVARLQPLGQGALELAFQQLKAKLETEGLFAAERKRPIPPYPMRIALVTSQQTAALQDMLKVLRRFPWVELCLYHVSVQGNGAAEMIAAALTHLGRCASQIGGIDVILLGRGGGSLEDLWQFNEEVVARAMARCPIPIITGIGHEVDVSIADLVADHHAHTPTEAAQVAMAHWRTARDEIDQTAIRLRRELRRLVEEARRRLIAMERHELFRRPRDRVQQFRQLLDDRHRALDSAIARRLHLAHQHLGELAIGLGERHPRHRLVLVRHRLGETAGRLKRALSDALNRWRQKTDLLSARLEGVNPSEVLKRGYSITLMKKTGAVVRSATATRAGDRLLTRLADGQIESTVEDARQPKLFE